MNYALIKNLDVANGPGLRVSLFVSGCNHHCKGCFNPETWDFHYGQPFTEDTIQNILQLLGHPYTAGLSLLGGEPLEQVNQKGLLPLVRKVKEVYPQKNIWCYTGFDFEKDVLGKMVKDWPETKELLTYVDVVVDGKFVEEQKNLNLRFRGSSNQRVIMVKDTLQSGQVVNWDDKR